MGWWKADPVPEPQQQQQQQPSPPTPSSTPIAPHPISPTDSASSCPVDPQTRSIWLQAAKAKQQQSQTQQPTEQTIPKRLPPVVPTAVAPSQECSSDRIDQSPPPAASSKTSTPQDYKPGTLRPLSHDREVSTIPRAYPLASPSSTTTTTTAPDKPAIPSNSETETGPSASGNWIYPSETQFYSAVMRKQTSANPKELATSISSIIPIHNAVNERAWHMIRAWEQDSSEQCGGPKLLRFEGKGAGAKSPRAWMKSWAGYTEPFDRHDWTVQRCDGTEVEYVIDFYQGRAASAGDGLSGAAAGPGAAGLNFFLDVRPKLNSVEGCKMRFEKAVGWR